jgi:hypothetical protein
MSTYMEKSIDVEFEPDDVHAIVVWNGDSQHPKFGTVIFGYQKCGEADDTPDRPRGLDEVSLDAGRSQKGGSSDRRDTRSRTPRK